MLAAERKSRIIDFLESNGKAEVNELADILSVVPETIRRDLRELELQGLLVRTHGGAVMGEKKELEYPVFVREMQNYTTKLALCKKAAQYVEEDDTIYVDNSSTLINIMRYIDKDMNVTLLTNSIGILQLSSSIDNNVTVICSGGAFNKKNMSLSGSLANHMCMEFIPDKAFVSCHGLSVEYGLTDGSMNEAAFKRNMMRVSQRTYCVVDHSKFEKTGPVKLAGLDTCDVLICDRIPDPHYLDQLCETNAHMDIICCDYKK
ncbi:MAG: DeoR/GlpR family DNA-binding transcription regulator [Christensenella sp.]|nr:DeoR/GlpR family DNA-binding transcription regulator [Christensenella sp.]